MIHWKFNHYAAILEKRNDRYLIADGIFNHPRWMSLEAIQEEASGFFMVPADKLPASWKQVDSVNANTISGCCMGNNDVDDSEDEGENIAPTVCPEDEEL